MKTKTLVHLPMTLAVTLLLAACGGDSGGGGGGGNTTPANIAPTVTGPVMSAADDNDTAYTITTAELIANASDADGDALTVDSLVIDSGNPTGVVINGSAVDVDPTAYDSLATSDSELIELSYNISDGNGGSVATTLEITISGANDAPTRVALSNILLANGQPTAGGFAVGNLYSDDPDGDSPAFSISGGTDAANFSVSGISLIIDNGVVSASDQDRYEVTVRATDSGGASLDYDVTLLVFESAALTVGYYDILTGTGKAEQATPITFIGETAVNITDLDAADLSGMDMLFVQNPSSGAPTGPFVSQANLDKVADFVSDGGVMIFHDRHVATTASILPGDAGTLTQDAGANRTEFNVVDSPTFVTEGPGGTIDDTNLESPNSLSFGFGEASSVPPGSAGYLSRNDPDTWVTYSYPVGAGQVIYSTIPLDFYLLSGNPEIMRSTYAPNILAQGRALRKKGTDTDGDTLLDVEEAILGTMANNDDSDVDGMSDPYEVRNGLDPNDAGDSDRDPDEDGLTNQEEFVAGTLPRLADTDGDGLNDGDEVLSHLTDPLDTDSDDDLLTDFQEINVDGTDPNVADTDTGGTDDGREVLVDGTDPLDPADDLSTIALPVTLNDSNGYIWDIQRDGSINNGTIDAYDGGMRLLVDSATFPQFDEGSDLAGGREVHLGSATMSGLTVSRRVYIPTDDAFARYLEILSNPTGSDIDVQLQIATNLGSDGGTVIVSTSDGDPLIEATDTWVVTDDASNGGGDPSLAHVVAGAGSSNLPTITAPLGLINYTYDVTVPANGRAIVMHFDSQNANRAVAIASAGSLGGLASGTLANISTEEMADIVNFFLAAPATVSRPALHVVAPMTEVGNEID